MVTSRKFCPICLGHIGGSHVPHELVDEMRGKIRHHSPGRDWVVMLLHREDRSTKKWVMFKRWAVQKANSSLTAGLVEQIYISSRRLFEALFLFSFIFLSPENTSGNDKSPTWMINYLSCWRQCDGLQGEACKRFGQTGSGQEFVWFNISHAIIREEDATHTADDWRRAMNPAILVL